MITHSIDKYKVVYPPPVEKGWVRQEGGGWNRASPLAMSKLEYALFVKNLPIKDGHFVCSQFNKIGEVLSKHTVYYVKEIDQIHRHVDWGDSIRGPVILNLFSIDSASTWKAGCLTFRKLTSVETVPIEWVERVKRDNLYVEAV